MQHFSEKYGSYYHLIILNYILLHLFTNYGVLSEETGITCGQTKKRMTRGFVFGGENAKQGDWPWLARIETPKTDPGFICGGALIHVQWVLSATHCFAEEEELDKLLVFLGNIDRRINKINRFTQIIKVSEVFRHPKYEDKYQTYDIALLKLRKPAKLNKMVGIVCLPQYNLFKVTPLRNGRMGVIMGWGEGEDGALPNILQVAKVPFVPDEKCQDVYGKYFIPGLLICTGYRKGSKTTTGGDSGGPITFPERDSDGQIRFIVRGIVNYGRKHPKRSYTGSANVTRHMRWITKTTKLKRFW